MWQRPHRILLGVSSPGGHHFGIKTWPSPTAYRFQSWNTSAQTISRLGTHLSADRWPIAILNTQPLLNTLLDMTLRNRRTRSSSTHQWEGTSPSHQGSLYKPHDQPPQPEGRHQKQAELQFCSLGKGDHKHSKLNKMTWQRNMLQMKEQD